MPAIRGYLPLRPIGRGSSATVHLHRECGSGRLVAIKIGDRLPSDAAAAAFRQEATLMSRVCGNPCVLTMLDSGVTADRTPYLILDFAPNGSLADLLRRSGPLPVESALDLGIRMASALAAAHRLGVVHRDVKPSNILLDADGAPLLADFSIAATVYDARQATGWSSPWAAPEVLSGRSGGDERSDCYALAATLHAAVSGPAVSRGRRDADAAVRQLHDLLACAMSPDPDQRPASALDFARRLQALQARIGVQVTPVTADGIAPFAPASPTAPPASAASPTAPTASPPHALPTANASQQTDRKASQRRGRRLMVPAAAAATLLALGLAAAAVPSLTAHLRSVPTHSIVEIGPSASEAPSYPHVDNASRQ